MCNHFGEIICQIQSTLWFHMIITKYDVFHLNNKIDPYCIDKYSRVSNHVYNFVLAVLCWQCYAGNVHEALDKKRQQKVSDCIMNPWQQKPLFPLFPSVTTNLLRPLCLLVDIRTWEGIHPIMEIVCNTEFGFRKRLVSNNLKFKWFIKYVC